MENILSVKKHGAHLDGVIFSTRAPFINLCSGDQYLVAYCVEESLYSRE